MLFFKFVYEGFTELHNAKANSVTATPEINLFEMQRQIL